MFFISKLLIIDALFNFILDFNLKLLNLNFLSNLNENLLFELKSIFFI